MFLCLLAVFCGASVILLKSRQKTEKAETAKTAKKGKESNKDDDIYAWENIPDYERPVLEKFEPHEHPDYQGREKTKLTKVSPICIGMPLN